MRYLKRHGILNFTRKAIKKRILVEATQKVIYGCKVDQCLYGKFINIYLIFYRKTLNKKYFLKY